MFLLFGFHVYIKILLIIAETMHPKLVRDLTQLINTNKNRGCQVNSPVQGLGAEHI